MRRAAKRRKVDSGATNFDAEGPNGALQKQHHNNRGSSSFDGTGIAMRDGNFHVQGDLHLNSPVPTTAGSKSTTREQLLESLQFDQIDARQLSVKKAHAKTCRWFLKTSLYQKWENKNIPAVDNQFLWIKGKPGAGKSTLMKFLLEHIRSRIRQQKNTDVIISFFFNARGNDLEKSTIGLYRSLLFQLLDGRPELQHVLDAVRPGRQWDLDLLKSLFERAIQALENASVVCLIDALDECEEAQIRDMVDVLNGLVNEENRLQICFASRHYPHITIQTGLSVILENQSEHENDIANYLSTTLRIGQGRLAEQIRTDLQKKASGVFMWVVLVVDILNKEYDEGGKHHLKERLQQLPSDLHNLFQSILLRDSKHQAGLLLCIQWVLFAKQPLTTKQLYFAILSGFESQYLADCHSEDYSEDDARKYILDKSKGLAEATKSKNPTIQFIHESVRDFLLKGDGFSKVFPQLGTNIQGQSHEALKQCCLTYMSMQSLSDLNESTCESVNAQFPFLNYANGGLLYHANQAQVYKICQQHFLTTFPHLEWVEHFNILEPHKLRRYTSKVSLLYILAEADTPALISIQAGRQSCFEVEDERYGLPILAAAAAKSHTTTLAMLELEAQRVSGFSFEKFCTQLRPIPDNLNADSRSFSFNGKQELFHQLVEHGSETVSLFFLSANPYVVDSKNKNGKTALMIAAANGHTILMEELFRRGANVSEKNRKGRTALHSASSEGVLAAATLLIDHGADVSAPAQGGGRPLHIAAHNGRIEVAKYLVDHGADISATDNFGETPLHKSKSIEVAKYFVDHGADISATDNSGETPLHKFTYEWSIEVTKYLVDHGADISATDNSGQTPLHKSADRGSIEVTKYLVDHGADISATDNYGQTPLHKSADRGSIEVTKYLVDHGADISAIDNSGQTPLHKSRSIEVAKYLVDHGADISATDNSGQTPLHKSADRGSIEVAKYLVDHGADISVKDNSGDTPLHKSAYEWSIGVAKYLVDHGADISVTDNSRDTPLHKSTYEWSIRVAKYLVDHDVDISATDNSGETPLQLARLRRNFKLVRLLS